MNKELINILRESSSQSVTDFINSYLDHEKEILNDINTFHGIKSELYVQDINSVIDISKYLSIYADLTSVFLMPDKVKTHIIHYYDPGDPHFINRKITFPLEELDGMIPKMHELLPAYTTQNEIDFKIAYKRFKPLLERGKFLIRPIRTIMLSKPALSPTGPVDGTIFYANSDTPNDDWHIKRLNEKDSYVVNNGLDLQQAKALYEITLPYISNVSIENLSKIIEDETDLLSTFRATLKELMKSSVIDNKASIAEIRNDKIRPQIETINRKFKKLINVHRLAVGSSVTAVTLTLVAITTGFGADFQSLFNPYIAGGLGVGILASEINFQNEEEKLKDFPYFLLWKISKAKATQILGQF